MGDFIKRARDWLMEKKGEVFFQVVLLPFLMWLMTYLTSIFFESEVIRAVLFGLALVTFVAGGCYLVAWFDRKKAGIPAVTPPPPAAPKAEEDKWRLACLLLLRMIEDGERRRHAFDSPDAIMDGYDAGLDLQAWHDATLATIRTKCGDYSEHFADMDAYGSAGHAEVNEQRKQADTLLKRMRELVDLLKTRGNTLP